MYQNEQFRQVGEFSEGQLTFKLPGTDIHMNYKSGYAFVNENNNVGHVTLAIREVVAEQVGEAEGMAGELGLMLAEQLDNKSVRKQMKQLLKQQDHSLFYSKLDTGVELITLPGFSGEYGISKDQLEGMIVATYSINGGVPDESRVYAHHASAIGNSKLFAGKDVLETQVMNLVAKSNLVYDKSLEIMKEYGSF